MSFAGHVIQTNKYHNGITPQQDAFNYASGYVIRHNSKLVLSPDWRKGLVIQVLIHCLQWWWWRNCLF